MSGLGLEGAVRGGSDWDLALVELDWEALNAGQAAMEASAVLGLAPIAPLDALKGAVGPWLAAQAVAPRIIPVVHVTRPLYHRRDWQVTDAAGAAAGLATSWRRR